MRRRNAVDFTNDPDAVELDNLAVEDSEFVLVSAPDQLFMSHGDWMRNTYRFFGSRSSQLRQLDEAILKAERISAELDSLEDDAEELFHRGLAVDRAEKVREAMEIEAYKVVRRAFEAWAKSEGDWRQSSRDSQGAMSTVYQRLMDLQKKYPSLVPDAKEIVTAGSEYTAQLFRGTKVTLRGADFDNNINSISQVKTVGSGLSSLGGLPSALDDLIHIHFGTSLQNVSASDPMYAQILSKIVPALKNKIHEFVALVPGINVAVSTVSALSKLYDVYKTDSNRAKLLQVSAKIPQGDAKESLASIKVWQDRYIRDLKKGAAMDAGAAGAQLLAILVPGAQPVSTLVGAAKSIAEMMNVIVELGAQYRESRALGLYLNSARGIDANIFAISPLVGAYYVLNVPFSVFSLHLVPFDSPTFFADTEYLRESGEMKAIMTDAERILDASKYILVKDGRPLRSRESMSSIVAAKLWGAQAKKRIVAAFNVA